MLKKLLYSLSYLFIFGAIAQAQNVPMTEPLSPDRPDFTDGTQTVAVNHTQIEGGYTYTRSGSDKSHSFGEILIRRGLSERAELRIGLNSYEVAREGGSHSTGRDDSELSVKYILSNGAEHFRLTHPATAVIVATSLPTGSRSQRGQGLQPFGKLALDWPLTEKVDVSANLDAARINTGGDHLTQLAASVSFGASLSPRVGAFAEYYALQREERGGKGAQFFDTGLSYLINPNLQVDARVGLGFNSSISGPDYFTGVGLSRRF